MNFIIKKLIGALITAPISFFIMNFIIKKLIGAVISALPTLAKAGSRPEFTKVATSVVPRNRNKKKKAR